MSLYFGQRAIEQCSSLLHSKYLFYYLGDISHLVCAVGWNLISFPKNQYLILCDATKTYNWWEWLHTLIEDTL